MVKVLVADEDVEQVTECCQYLSNNDQMLKTISANTGIDTLNKYNKMKADILILNSHFSDIKSTEIIDRLSNTIYERKNMNNNIIMTINSAKEQLAFVNTTKIYGFFQKPLNLEKIADIIRQIQLENKYDNLDEDYLNKLLFRMRITVGSFQTEILKQAISECYDYPYLLDNFDSVLTLLSYKHRGMDIESIRNAIRSSLNDLNKHREKLQSHKVVRMFELDRNISPKTFLEVVVSYLHSQKNQEIIF